MPSCICTAFPKYRCFAYINSFDLHDNPVDYAYFDRCRNKALDHWAPRKFTFQISDPFSVFNPVPFALPCAAPFEKSSVELWILRQIPFFAVCCHYHCIRTMCHGEIKFREPVLPRREDIRAGLEAKKKKILGKERSV